jgi:hypothetical protein
MEEHLACNAYIYISHFLYIKTRASRTAENSQVANQVSSILGMDNFMNFSFKENSFILFILKPLTCKKKNR